MHACRNTCIYEPTLRVSPYLFLLLLPLKCLSFGASSRTAPEPACSHVCGHMMMICRNTYMYVCMETRGMYARACVFVHVHQVACTWSAETPVRTRQVRVRATCLYLRWKCYLCEYNLYSQKKTRHCLLLIICNGWYYTNSRCVYGDAERNTYMYACMRLVAFMLCVCVFACTRCSYALLHIRVYRSRCRVRNHMCMSIWIYVCI